MQYNFYQRKEENISKHEAEWINANFTDIALKENILFVFQTMNESLLFTTDNIYFPNRKTKAKLQYKEILKIKTEGDLNIEVITKDKNIFTIGSVSPIDKVKLFRVLTMLKNDFDLNVKTIFLDIHKEFSEFKVIKYPLNQSQHKIPQVYLKEFGYLNKDHWKLTILNKAENFTRQKSIESFPIETNVFDIESEDDRFPRMFESLNGELETLYPKILADISINDIVSEENRAILVELTSNFMVRSDSWRHFVNEILISKNKNTFLELIVSVDSTSYEDLQEIKNQIFFKELSEGEFTISKLNKTLILFQNYLSFHLHGFNLIILRADHEKKFFTSDNPVNFMVNQEEGKLGLFSKNTKVYFPLSRNYLAYFYHENSTDRNLILSEMKNRGIYNVMDVLTDDEYVNFIKEKIFNSADVFIIVPGELKYKFPL